MVSSSRKKMTVCCRICLCKKAQKDVSELQCDDIPEIDNNHRDEDIMFFCLDVRVSESLQVSRSLCNKCYKKVISFYIFKVQAIKNDAYLRSLQNTEQDKDTDMQDHHLIHHLLKAEETEDLEVKIEADYDVLDDQSELSLKNDLNYLDVKAEDTEKEESDNDILSVLKVKNRKIRQNCLSEKNCKTEENFKISSNISMKAPPKKRGPKKKLKIVQGVIPQVCEQCGKSFTNLKEHMEQHKDPADRKMYQCKSCPKIFYSYGARFKHNNRKHLMIKKKCTICEKDYSDLNAHTVLVHNREMLRFVCVVCERRFISQSALNCHFQSHTKDKPFQCDKCNKKFQSKFLLALHIRNVHNHERSHMCHLCSKSFFKKYALQIHLRIHTKELPYTCDECGKRFRTRNFMKNHVVRHTGVKRCACTLCDMKFYTQGALSAHMISHTKEKRHACHFCGVQFGRTDHRNRHERTAHGHDRLAHGTERT